jgi:hypothetical protein
MKTLITLFVIGASVALLSGCSRDDRPCLAAHDETYMDVVPVMTGLVNGVAQFSYIPEEETRTVCDKYGESATRYADGKLKPVDKSAKK